MPNLWLSDQVAQILYTQGSAIAGIGGAKDYPRATQVRGILKVYKFSWSQETPIAMPGDTATVPALNDQIVLALLKPTDYLYFGRLYLGDFGGTDLFLSVGRIDPNNSTNNDVDRYLAAVDVSGAASIKDLDLNMMTQVGTDPAGDQSIGNKIPSFGSADIQITAQITGTTIGTVAAFSGFLMVVEEGN